ncbi:hypothetical protein BGZ46_008648 [Entomortierella lignicola]|nr:hypothetical protein BGZ46_008648 [Entomortierella lignicola]
MDHTSHHIVESDQHARYSHNEHIGYQHSRDSQSPVFRGHSSAITASATEVPRPMTPPNHGHPNLQISSATTIPDTRQRSLSTSTPGLGSPVSGPGPSYSTKSSDAPKRPSTAVNQSSLPSRSLSIVNILNATETEGNSDMTEIEEDVIASSADFSRESHARDYPENTQPYLYHPEPASTDSQKSLSISSEGPFTELEHTDEYDGKGIKLGNEKAPRPMSKEKVSKDKNVKASKVTKKAVPIKMPPKKKASISSATLPISDSSVTAVENDVEYGPESMPQIAQDQVVGQKHGIDEAEKGHEDPIAKKVRVDDPSNPEGERINSGYMSPLPGWQYGETTPMKNTQIQKPTSQSGIPAEIDDIPKSANPNVSMLPDKLAARLQGSPRPKQEPSLIDNHGSMLKSSNAINETMTHISGVAVPITSTAPLTPAPSTPAPTVSAPLTAKPKGLPESDYGGHSKNLNEVIHDDPTQSREPLKGTKPTPIAIPSSVKEKKAVKKKLPIESSQQPEEAVVTNKAAKNNGPYKDIEDVNMDIVDIKPSVKPVSKKSASVSSPHSNSLKKRFSKSVESISKPIEDQKHTDVNKATGSENAVASQDKTTGEGMRDKSVKPKRVDRADLTLNTSSKSENLKNQQPSSQPRDSPSSLGNRRADEEEKLYCICKTPYDKSRFMIACDGCDDWFHGDCVGVAEKDSEMVDMYYCKRCEEKGRHVSGKRKCIRGSCQKPAARKSKYCSKECGLLLATQRIHESQARAFGIPIQTETAGQQHPPEQAQQQLQRRRRLTLADLDDRQRLLSIREKMSHVRKVCSILDAREAQLAVCIDRQTRQDLGKLVVPPTSLATDKDDEKAAPPEDDDDEGVARNIGSNSSKSKSKGKNQKTKDKDKDKEAFCGFDYSLVWDDVHDMSRIDRATLASLTTTPTGSRASSVAPPSFGVVLVNSKKQGLLTEDLENQSKARNGAALSPDEQSLAINNLDPSALSVSPQMEEVGLRVCMTRRQCDRHNGWQKLKGAELDLEKTLQNKLLKTLKSEAKLVKRRMKRRRNDLSAGLLNGTIEHRLDY